MAKGGSPGKPQHRRISLILPFARPPPSAIVPRQRLKHRWSVPTRATHRPSPRQRRTMPGKRDRPPRPKHDASYKSFFAVKRTVVDTLRGALGDLAPGLDFSTLQRLPASFVTEHLGQRHADMLWRIQVAGHGWLYLLVLLEFQSTIDRRMALRMMDYTVRVLQGLDRDDLGPARELPFILPMVVYNGERRWNAATDIRDLFPPAPGRLVGYVPRHRYLLIELQTLDASRLPPDNALSMIARRGRRSSWRNSWLRLRTGLGSPRS